MIDHILVAVDGSLHALAALDLASDLANRLGARLTVLHVRKQSDSSLIPRELLASVGSERTRAVSGDEPEDIALEIVRRAAERARDNGVATVLTAVEIGNPAARIVEHARKNDVGMIVMGRRGLSDLQELLLGSVSHKVLQLADCACLTVKGVA
jgi:nucleotide-binding universal stress UspA family protein